MSPMPGPVQLIKEESDALAEAAAHTGCGVFGMMSMAISPIAIHCNEAWKPLLEKAANQFGYCWEWVPGENEMPPDHPCWQENPWSCRQGHAVLRKV